MTFGEAIATCLTKKYVTFEGRASRSEYWYFVLFYVLCSIGSALGYILGDAIGMFLSGLVGLILFLPALGVLVRRFHDIGKSGWFVLLALIPLIGTILVVVFCCRKGEAAPNRFGAQIQW